MRSEPKSNETFFFHLLDEISSLLDPAAAPGKILAVWAVL